MRDARDVAGNGDLGNGFIGAAQQVLGVQETLFDLPFVWGVVVCLAEISFEGGGAAIAFFGQIFDRKVVEDMESHDRVDQFAPGADTVTDQGNDVVREERFRQMP